METDAKHPLEAYRKANGLSQEAFGALIGVQKAAISKVENGQTPSPEMALAIHKVTNGTVSRRILRADLWGDEGEAA